MVLRIRRLHDPRPSSLYLRQRNKLPLLLLLVQLGHAVLVDIHVANEVANELIQRSEETQYMAGGEMDDAGRGVAGHIF